MEFNNQKFKLVFAHPDDEVLWASSLIESSSKIITCFLDSPENESVRLCQLDQQAYL